MGILYRHAGPSWPLRDYFSFFVFENITGANVTIVVYCSFGRVWHLFILIFLPPVVVLCSSGHVSGRLTPL